MGKRLLSPKEKTGIVQLTKMRKKMTKIKVLKTPTLSLPQSLSEMDERLLLKLTVSSVVLH